MASFAVCECCGRRRQRALLRMRGRHGLICVKRDECERVSDALEQAKRKAALAAAQGDLFALKKETKS